MWGEAVISQFDMTSQYAAPAQPFGITPTDPATMVLWDKYVQPYLTATNQTATQATLGYRVVSRWRTHRMTGRPKCGTSPLAGTVTSPDGI